MKVKTFITKLNELKFKITKALALALFLLVLVANFIDPLEQWLMEYKLLGSTTMLAIAYLILEAISEGNEKDDHGDIIIERSAEIADYMKSSLTGNKLDVVFAGYTSETLYRILSECFHDIKTGKKSITSISIRILIPDLQSPSSIPCFCETLKDHPEHREASKSKGDEYVWKIKNAVNELLDGKKIRTGTVDVRYHSLSPLLKVYIINNKMAFFGLYSIEKAIYRATDGEEIDVFDFKGTRTKMLGCKAGLNGNHDEYISLLRDWYESVWSQIAG